MPTLALFWTLVVGLAAWVAEGVIDRLADLTDDEVAALLGRLVHTDEVHL